MSDGIRGEIGDIILFFNPPRFRAFDTRLHLRPGIPPLPLGHAWSPYTPDSIAP